MSKLLLDDDFIGFYWLQRDLYGANALQAALCTDTYKQTCTIYTLIWYTFLITQKHIFLGFFSNFFEELP